MIPKILFSFATVAFLPLAHASFTDTADIQFTIQASVMGGRPAFTFGAAEIEKCPLRFLYHPGPILKDGETVPGFEITIVEDVNCLTRIYRAWNEAYAAMDERGAVDRIAEQVRQEYAQTVESCLQLKSEFEDKYRGELDQMNEEERRRLDEVCLAGPPEGVIQQRLMEEPEAKAWKSEWKAPLDQTLTLDKLTSHFDGRPVLPNQEIEKFIEGGYYLTFQLRAYHEGKDSTLISSIPIKFEDLEAAPKTIYNQFSNDKETTPAMEFPDGQ